MPESPPPIWGSAYDERDLEALLSGGPPGETYDLPEALRPVAGTLAALTAAPVRGELSGEAAAMAAFRTFTPVAGPWAAEAEHGTVTARALAPSPTGRGQRRAARHRRRPGARAARRPLVVATGAVAVAVIAAAVVLTGVLPASITRLPRFGRPTGAGTSAAGSAGLSASQRVEGGATREPTPAASGAPRAKQSPGALCSEYYSFFAHQEPSTGRAAQDALGAKLDALAGSPGKVFSYCLPYLDYLSWGKAPWTPRTTPPGTYSAGRGVPARQDANPGAGGSGAGRSGAGDSGAGGSGSGSSGAGGSGTGDGGSRSGSGQGQPGHGN